MRYSLVTDRGHTDVGTNRQTWGPFYPFWVPNPKTERYKRLLSNIWKQITLSDWMKNAFYKNKALHTTV